MKKMIDSKHCQKSSAQNALLLMFITMLLTLTSCSNSKHAHLDKVLLEIKNNIDAGQFDDSRHRIKQLLNDGLTKPADQKTLRFELERMARIEMDFNATYDDITAYINKYAPDITDAQIKQWDDQGEFEFRLINGKKRYFKNAAYNLFQLNDQALANRPNYQRFVERGPLYSTHQHHVDVLNQTLKSSRSHVSGNRFTIKYHLTVKADAVPAGETIKAWLPFPRAIDKRQINIKLLATSHDNPIIAPNSNLQRTVYMEAQARENQEEKFWVEYQFDAFGSHHNIDANSITSINKSDPNIQPFLKERAPHILFTDEIKALSQRIVGDETNPYKIAQKIYAYVDTIKWGTAIEYSTVRNLSMRAVEAPYADCGQQSMLLITLLRLNGIPAKWQSGWEFSPTTFHTMHDWAEVYFEPYGWVPVDVTHGLLDSTDPRLKWFYLGGIDSYRAIFNDDYSQEFYPAKQYFRSETVDSQRGEVEWRGGNLYFDQWQYKMDWQVKPLQKDFNLNQLNSKQVVVVITENQDAIAGQLQRFEKQNDEWRLVSEPHPVVVGRTGLAWGIGLHPEQDGYHKQEGDGKAPAGIFSLSSSFGYLSHLNTRLDYQQMSSEHYCMDVRGSQYYNQTIDAKHVLDAQVEKSSEAMRRDIHSGDHLYKKGIFVDHNPNNISDQGSCIFVHLWRNENKPTAGCTAMEEDRIDELLDWLDKDKNPLMIALTKQDYLRLKPVWALP